MASASLAAAESRVQLEEFCRRPGVGRCGVEECLEVGPVLPSLKEREAAAKWVASDATLATFDGEGSTANGHQVPLLANVGNAKGAEVAAALGAQGVGLFRTEFCLLERDTEPSVNEQADAYRAVFPGKKVVVRTRDGGRGQAPAVPHRHHRTEPGPGCARLSHLPDYPGRARALALRDRCRRRGHRGRGLGHGPDDLDTARGCAFRLPLRQRRREASGRHGGGPFRRSDGVQRPQGHRVRLARHQRPHAVCRWSRTVCSDRWRA